MSAQLMELKNELKNVTEAALRPLAEQLEAEQKARTGEQAETKQALDRVHDQLDQLEARFTKIGLDAKSMGAGLTEAKAAFLEWARKGDGPDFRKAIESKAISMSDESSGGVLAPAEFVIELIRGQLEYDPVRQLARVRSTVAQSVKVPKRTGTFSATWISEQGTRSETTGLQFGLVEIPTHELYALVDIYNQLLEDNVFNLESELGFEFSQQFGVAEGTAFVTGSGVGRPQGIVANTDVSTVTSNSNDALAANDFIDLLYQLKEPYHEGATFLLNRLTVRDARKLKDSNGQYLWQPALASDIPATILGKPYRMSPAMATVADAAKAVIVGDFQKGYNIVDRIDLQVQRDPFTQNTAGATRFIARKRVGGQVVDPAAFKILVIA